MLKASCVNSLEGLYITVHPRMSVDAMHAHTDINSSSIYG